MDVPNLDAKLLRFSIFEKVICHGKKLQVVWNEIGLQLCLLIQNITMNCVAIVCALYIYCSYKETFSL